jgi:hypothetical protein
MTWPDEVVQASGCTNEDPAFHRTIIRYQLNTSYETDVSPKVLGSHRNSHQMVMKTDW